MNEDIFQLGLKALIRNKQGQILILKNNPKLTTSSGSGDHWDLPGGRIHKGENIEDALNREVKEEIGVDNVKIIKLLDASISKLRFDFDKESVGLILFTFLCSIKNIRNVRLIDAEHTEFRWVTPKQATNLLSVKFSDSFIEVLKNIQYYGKA